MSADGFSASYDFIYQRVSLTLTPKQLATRRRAWLRMTAWNPLPRFGLRVPPHPLHDSANRLAMTWRANGDGWEYWSRHESRWKRESAPQSMYDDCVIDDMERR